MTTMTARTSPASLNLADPASVADLAMSLAGPAWLRPIRESALSRFTRLGGLPTTEHEEWRFTSLAPLTKTPFRLSAPHPRQPITRAEVEHLSLDLPAAAKLVFIDGHLVPEYSTLHSLPTGVTVLPLADALTTHRSAIEPLVARFAESEQDALAALNTALLSPASGGAFIHIARERTLETPILLLNITTEHADHSVTHPRNIVIADEAAEASIVEDYVSLASASYLTNAVTEIVAGPSARLTHTFVQRESRRATNISTLRAHQHAGSTLSSHSLLLGGALVRNNVHLTLEGERCDSLLNGLFIPAEGQHHDNHMRVVHAAPHCTSRQFYQGILDASARGVFSGRIIVAQGAQKTDAIQRNNNLLLSDSAQIDTKPQLEIYADDVRCTHGATIGQLNDDAIFYLRARGLSLDEARGLLIYAFAAETLGRIASEPLRNALRPHILNHLPQGARLKDVL